LVTKKESLVRKAEEFKERNHVITGDVYSMTFASLIDHTVIRKNKQMQGDGFLPPIELTEEETGRMFLGALMVIGIQMCMVGLLINEMLGPHFSLKPASNFIIIIPRLLSSVMMHLIVEPDIRNGISLMKYCCNQPHMFKGSRTDDGKLNTFAVASPFFLGFMQTFMGIIIEYMVIIFLSSLDDLMSICMKFAAMTFVINVDNMYANALFENKMKTVPGKKLYISFHNNMQYESHDENDGLLSDTDFETGRSNKLKKVHGCRNPRSHSLFLKLLRFINKVFRTFYVCFNYYFMPYMSLVFVFALNHYKMKHHTEPSAH
jgi:hypothetical protein